MAKAEIVPFGKYKGQPVEALAQDKEYCEWLIAQDWFRAKFTAIHTLIINNFGEPSETPEHNQLQALFTDREFRRKFVWHLDNARFLAAFRERRKRSIARCAEYRKSLEEDLAKYRLDLPAALRELEEHEAQAARIEGDSPPAWVTGGTDHRQEDWKLQNKRWKVERLSKDIPERQGKLDKVEAMIVALEAMPEPEIGAVKTQVKFESDGVDVALTYTVAGFPWVERFGLEINADAHEDNVCVECKPALSDNYPAVLRQILGHQQGRSVLLVGNGGYTGTGATLEQVKAIFESRSVRIVFLKDLPYEKSPG